MRQVRQALEHLYDFAYLQRHPLARSARSGVGHTAEMAGQTLRSELVAAIEAQSPGPDVPFRAPAARLYNLLHLQYIEGMTVQEAGRELGISTRQAFRDLKLAVSNVAAILWAHHSAPTVEASRVCSVQAEVERLEMRPQPVDVRSLLQQARSAVERLAERRGVRMLLEAPVEPVTVSTDPVVAQQVLVSTLSQVVQQARPGDLRLSLTATPDCACLTVGYAIDAGDAHPTPASEVTACLVDRLGWQLGERVEDGARQLLTLTMAVCGPTLLVIDDNQDLAELLERYLSGHACRLLTAGSGYEGLLLAQQSRPAAIVLDVMMPAMDGWQTLQTLRTDPQTASIPVIICTVFDDPELAYSLGASSFLPKPVSQDDILTALHKVGVL